MIYSLNMVISFASFRYCRILSFYQWYCPNISCLFSWQCYLTVLHHSTPRLSCFSCVTSQGCHDSSGLASTGAGSRTHPGWKNPRVFARFFFLMDLWMCIRFWSKPIFFPGRDSGVQASEKARYRREKIHFWEMSEWRTRKNALGYAISSIMMLSWK